MKPNIMPVSLGNYPTPIIKLERLSKELGKSIYVKRDDYSGIELSGNKTRKIEYSLGEALSKGADTIITCGAVQSNHARATVSACRVLGLDVHLVIRTKYGKEPEGKEGNNLLDYILGAKITYLSEEEFKNHNEVIESIKKSYLSEGKKPYLIPVGASNGVGTLGYFSGYEEILTQERNLDINFDSIVCTIGSGGTFAGLWLGNEIHNKSKNIIGISISEGPDYFKEKVQNIIKEISIYFDIDFKDILKKSESSLDIVGGYQGGGYAISTKEERDFIEEIALKEGIIFDPVYTGKAFRGLVSEIKNGGFQDSENILFIHTGGIFGSFSYHKFDS